jgi:RecJ-like exonuclease
MEDYMRDKIKVNVYTNRDAIEVAFSARWVICSACEGCATDRGRSVECDGGGFTSSEWAEQDDEFKQDYLAGRYDRPCTYCNGLGRVQEIDEEQVQGWREKILYKEYCRQLQDNYDIDAMQAAERRMGA